ncbi:conserved hypothetical protein [Xenorhabdus bovienii str. Jollieti]|uniref:DUF2357 domain-containing protein n=1 Tax=Xenorhabdus bovienii (strain SS-2004) TaxID=406818 RepID=D3V054_XENBS|nr:hypothetical protein [Xenorhabdus bovienii]CBJ80606.1 conserved hypothetical protein [Xenorhabdus bovienii SS-2004]CDH29470.1 conserved hypothetical protein [Xenorhabdus bovienii str. Jollieti]
MWLDRLTGETISQLPSQIEAGRYQLAVSSLVFNSHTTDFSGVLVSDGGERCQLGDEVRTFVMPRQVKSNKSALLFRAVETIYPDMMPSSALISPLMPGAIIDQQSQLLPFEQNLLEVVKKGHLHQISQRPRLDVHYEDEVADIARARRLAKGALVHLASHSECWQRQTLNGVIPRKVLARFSHDDYDIYENRVYARLLDKAERHLRTRLSTLLSLQVTLEQALEFYQTEGTHHLLAYEVCQLWGMTFNEDKTNQALVHLNETVDTLHMLHKTLSGLQQTGLYTLVNRNAQVTGILHPTNILGHDPHYRHLTMLWELLDSTTVEKTTPQERFRHNQYLVEAYSRYAGLVLRHALYPYLQGESEGLWAGKTLQLAQKGLEWHLICRTEKGNSAGNTLLILVPWLTDLAEPINETKLTSERFVAWPSQDLALSPSGYVDNWIALSPSDMYCVERFGLLINRTLYRQVLKSFARPITKIPTKALAVAEKIAHIHVEHQSHCLTVQGEVADIDLEKLKRTLKEANAHEKASDVVQRCREILFLQSCPVCQHKTTIAFQPPGGFKTICGKCGTERYLRQKEEGLFLEQTGTKGVQTSNFMTLGKRSFSMQI